VASLEPAQAAQAAQVVGRPLDGVDAARPVMSRRGRKPAAEV
jgi:hypothetical protein